EALAWATARMREAFPLHHAHLHESVLLKVSEAEYWYLCRTHHLVADGWSYALWAREIAQRYVACRDGRSLPVRDDTNRLVRLFAQEGEYARTKRYANALAFWRRELDDLPAPALLPRPGASSTVAVESVRTARRVPADEYVRLEACAAALDASVHHL